MALLISCWLLHDIDVAGAGMYAVFNIPATADEAISNLKGHISEMSGEYRSF